MRAQPVKQRLVKPRDRILVNDVFGQSGKDPKTDKADRQSHGEV